MGQRNVRILVVDDEPDILESLTSLLEMTLDADVATARSGAEAEISLARDGPFDALITDYRMPGMLGTQLIERARKSHPKMRCILMTAYREGWESARFTDVDAAFLKPLEGELFVERVRSFLPATPV